MVNFRLTVAEYEALQRVCRITAVPTVSELARKALQRMIVAADTSQTENWDVIRSRIQAIGTEVDQLKLLLCDLEPTLPIE